MMHPEMDERPRRWHETLRQSVENPFQSDRLKCGPMRALEHRTRINSPADRRALWIYFAWQLGVRVALLVLGKFLSNWRYGVGNHYFALLIFVSVISCARGVLFDRSPLVRWITYLLICPLLAAPAFLFDRPYYDYALGIAAVCLLADRLATHHFYSLTLTLLPRRKQWARLLWQNRLHLLDRAERRIAFYLLAVSSPLLFYSWVLYERQAPVEYMYGDDLFILAPVVAMSLGLAFLLEPTINFLYSQPVLHPLVLLRITGRVLLDWATYNLHNRAVPGVFVSPAGPIRPRLQLLFGALILIAVPNAELSFYTRVNYPPDESPRANVALSSSSEIHLEPYQKALLAKMDERERREFLANLPASVEAEETGQLRVFLDVDDQRTQQEMNEFDIRVSYLALLVMSSPISIPILALIPAFLLSAGVFLLGIMPAIARAHSEALDRGATLDQTLTLDAAAWEQFVTLLQSSPVELEKKSFFLGLNAADGSPVTVPRSVFEEHAHFLGDSGSGKTALGLAPLISQMIRSQDCSVVIIDLKGDDPALLENARLEAERAGLRFRWFTNELGKATYVFNPLLQRHLGELSLYQRTDLLTASLGLQYGTDYGRGFFSDANAELLYHALRARPETNSFVELANVLKQREPFLMVSNQLKMAGSHLAAIVTRLASTEALNTRPGPDVDPALLEAAIDMRQAFEEPQVIYFHLSSALGTATSAEIARMAMFSLLTSSKFVEGKRRQVFLIVDEFQRAVSNNLELFLQTARSMNIGVILANQSLSDLRKPGVDIVSTVRTNTRYRQLFAIGEMHDLQEAVYTSGETLLHSRGWSEALGLTVLGGAGGIKSLSYSEVVSPRIRVNDLLLASDHPRQSVCHVRRGEGHAQFGGMPFILESTYHITPQEYTTRKEAEWPKQSSETFTPTLATTDPIASQTKGRKSKDKSSDGGKSPVKILIDSLNEHYEEQKAAKEKTADQSPSTPEE
ncbi:MAG: hypothetical protein KDD69_13715 [Bdellovibrionales bacterium]|nr:hypothetical protein [Bdellovibrionales bacterium]